LSWRGADAIFLADTVQTVENGPPEVFTEKAPKAWTEVSYYLGGDDDKAEGVKVNTGKRGEVPDDGRTSPSLAPSF
jgi:nucleosome binding factor SPN SPT16 subunit